MGRTVLYLVILVGIAYGGYSLFSGGGDDAATSEDDEEHGTNDADLAAGPVAPAEPVGPARPEVDVDDLMRRANEQYLAAGKAATRAEAVALRDKARRLYNQALMADPSSESAAKLIVRIEELNDRVLRSEEALEGVSFPYVFQPMDRLWTLCAKGFPGGRKVAVSPGFVMWMNGISDARSIQAGQVLMIPTEKLSLLVLKSRFELWVLLGGVYLRSFGVGLGKDDKTPEGTFSIETKIKDPDWYRGGRRIPFGSPENQLGTRWLGFRDTPQATGYGIHGTARPDSIGRAVSEGCVRMKNEEVEELFEWVSMGTKVVIVR